MTGVLALLFVAAWLIILSSCGTSIRRTSTTRAHDHAGRPPTGPTTPRAGRHGTSAGTPVGHAQRVPARGTTLVITVTRVIDPLRGSGAKVPPGMEAVGVLVAARNAGPAGYDSSATSDFSLLTAAGPASPVFVPSGTCQTYLQDFMNEIAPGQGRTGCVAFAIPRGEEPRMVRFSPDGGTAGVVRSWAMR